MKYVSLRPQRQPRYRVRNLSRELPLTSEQLQKGHETERRLAASCLRWRAKYEARQSAKRKGGDAMRVLCALAALACLAAVGPQRTEVVLLKFADHPEEPCTPASAAAKVFGQYAPWMLAESNGQEWIEGDAAHNTWGWLTLPHELSYYCTLFPNGIPKSCDKTGSMMEDIRPLLMPSFDVYDREAVILVFNVTPGGTSAGKPTMFTECTFNLYTLQHEDGHRQGLRHAGWMDCGANDAPRTLSYSQSVYDQVVDGCTAKEYWDLYDPMGNPQPSGSGHYSSHMRGRLGWQVPALTVSANRTVTIRRYNVLTTEPQDVRIPLPIPGYCYSLEYRPPVGVMVRLVRPYLSYSAETMAVNRNLPVTAADPFVDPYRQIKVELMSSDPERATVRVAMPDVTPPAQVHGLSRGAP